jgi:hypothetical protein
MPRPRSQFPLIKMGKNKGDMFVKQYPDPETKHYDINSLPVRNPDGMITVTVFLDNESYTADDPDGVPPNTIVRGPAKLVYGVWPDGKVDLVVYDLVTKELKEK